MHGSLIPARCTPAAAWPMSLPDLPECLSSPAQSVLQGAGLGAGKASRAVGRGWVTSRGCHRSRGFLKGLRVLKGPERSEQGKKDCNKSAAAGDDAHCSQPASQTTPGEKRKNKGPQPGGGRTATTPQKLGKGQAPRKTAERLLTPHPRLGLLVPALINRRLPLLLPLLLPRPGSCGGAAAAAVTAALGHLWCVPKHGAELAEAPRNLGVPHQHAAQVAAQGGVPVGDVGVGGQQGMVPGRHVAGLGRQGRQAGMGGGQMRKRWERSWGMPKHKPRIAAGLCAAVLTRTTKADMYKAQCSTPPPTCTSASICSTPSCGRRSANASSMTRAVALKRDCRSCV